jgi:L-lactate dehydrogenase complex protein LldF
MALEPNKFMQSATIALEDINVQTALDRAIYMVRGTTSTRMDEVTDVQAIRQQGRGAKMRALSDLPEMLERMEQNFTAKGGHVLWATDAAEARQHVLDICQKHDLKRGVKSKSMVTEEIELLPALEKAGIRMRETDLGEFIVQISGDHPSHIVMPVMHRTKEQIRDVFVEELNMEHTEDAAEMTAFARNLLRDEYLQADFGMSGGNFLIAETGTVAIVTNEGNGRLSTSIPRVHIAVVGIEKVVPTWEDFATLVQMLGRAGAGQRITVYVNMFNGPAREGDADGPEELYLILVDNGRSNIYGTEYTEALACLRCGACLNVCPVYKHVSGHSYGSVYSGPIGAVVTPLMQGKENAAYLPFASSLCGACKQACPVDINIPDMLLNLRRDLESVQEPIWKVGMKGYGFAFSHPLLYQIGGKSQAAITNAIMAETQKDHLDSLPYPLDGWTKNRDFPAFAAQSFHDWWRQNRGEGKA